MLRTPRAALLLLSALLFSFSGAAAAQDIGIPFEKFKLDNGLTVIVHEDRKAPVVAVAVWYKVGSKDEPEGKSGFAHLFEHLMFQGSENYNDEWFKPLQEVGATDFNGTTNIDRTNYFQTVPTTALDRILWMESDRMGHFTGAITQERLDEQREVVKNEKRQGENAPYGRVGERIFEGLFPKGHPYAHTTIGSMADIDAATLDDVKDWFETYYGPTNAILVVAGDINTDEARPLVEKYFGDIPPGPPLTTWESWIPARAENTREVQYDRVPQARIYRLWATPEDTSRISTDLYTAAAILGDGKNSRLYKDIVYDKQIATDVSVFNYEAKMASIFGIVATVKPGESVEAVNTAIDQSIESFLARGPSRGEVELVSTKTRAGIIRGLEKVGGFGGKAVTLAAGELVAGDPGFVEKELAWLAETTPKRVLSAAREWLRTGYHQIDILPYTDYANASEGVDRSTGLPDVAGETSLSFPDVEEATLSNGVKVVFARRATIPLVNIAVQFDAGNAADHGGKLGAAAFTMSMLDEGAGKRDALEISAELERLGASLGSGSSLDTSTVSLSVLTENLDPAMDLFGDVLREPTFAENEIDRLRPRWLAGIEQELANPSSIALRLLPPLLFGDDHAYGIPFTGSGTIESISALTRDDLVAYHQDWIRPENAMVFVVGDTTLAEITPLLEREIGVWSGNSGEVRKKYVAEVEMSDSARVILIDRPDSAQSYILAGHIAPPPDPENPVPVSAMNEAIGGSFISRLNLNLREDKGWSYGVRSLLFSAQNQRPWAVFAPVQTDKTKEALVEILTELNGYIGDNPPTATEIANIKLDNVRSLPGSFETASDVLSSLMSSARYGRAWDYPKTLPDKYQSLSPEQAAAAAREIIHPDRMTWVIIGDRTEIEAGIRELDLGPIEVKAMSEL